MKVKFAILLITFMLAHLGFNQKTHTVNFKNLSATDFNVGRIGSQKWTSNGEFWAFTDEGLIKHDGYKKKRYSVDSVSSTGPYSNNIITISQTEPDEIWLAYSDTSFITRINTVDETFEHINVLELTKDHIFYSPVVKVVKDAKGQFWLVTWGNGIVKFNPEGKNEILHFPLDSDTMEYPWFMKEFKEFGDGIFLGTFFKEEVNLRYFPVVYNANTGDYHHIDIHELTKPFSPDLQEIIQRNCTIVHWAHIDEKNNFWLGTYSGLIYIDNEKKTIKRIIPDGEDPKVQNQANCVNYIATTTHLWIISPNRGIMIVDIKSKKMNFLIHDPVNSNSLSSDQVRGISADLMGNLWITSGNNNVSIYVPFIHEFQMFYWKNMDLDYYNRSLQQVPLNQLTVLNSKQIFISSKTGLSVYDGSTFKLTERLNFKRLRKNFKKDNGVQNFKLIGDTLFFIFDNSPSFYNWRTMTHSISNTNNGSPSIAFRHDPKINRNITIVNTFKGVQITDYEKGLENPELLFQIPAGALSVVETFSFETHLKNWIFSENGGRFFIVNPTDSTYKLYSPSQKESYFPDSTVNSVLIQDDEMILVGTKNGLYEFNEITEETKDITIEAGLKKDDIVNAMVKDHKGNLWIALNTDIVCWNRVNKTSIRYDKSLGIIVSGFLPAVGQRDELGNIYFATLNGILIFNPDRVNLPKNELLLKLSEIIINEDTLNEAATNEFISGKTVLHWTENFIEFKFTTNQIFQLSPHQYKYRLIGLSDRWINNGTNNAIRFDNLQYGTYQLEVKATNTYKTESDLYQLKFEIKQPYYLSWWFFLIIGFFILGIILLYIKWREKALRKKQEILENTVKERTAEVVQQKQEAEFQRQEAEHQKHIVEEKQQEITDSITYAKRIQEAILPSDLIFQKHFNHSFILYKPKDIVAGDFYWLEILNENIIFAAADCTGHGVPGAMVSVVCNNALNRTVREFGVSEPGKLLDKTRELVIDQFSKSTTTQAGNKAAIKDGMDISLCRYNPKNQLLLYAGANNPLWIIRSGEMKDENRAFPESANYTYDPATHSTLIEIKANKQPIGEYDQSVPFTTHTIQLQTGDLIYIFSDGYVDQFGGDKGKKFKPSSLRELLFTVSSLSMREQQAKLNEAFENWKGNYEQVDDVCVIGIKI